ncbi:MAG: hypothetical protein ACK4N1_20310, partial [Pseudorhizobium sp.]
MDSEASYTNTGVEVTVSVAGVDTPLIVDAFSTSYLMEEGFTFETVGSQTTANDATDYYLQVNDDQWVKLTTTQPTDQAVAVKIGTDDYWVDDTAATDATLEAGFSVFNLDITETGLAAVAGNINGSQSDALSFMIQYVDDQLTTMTSAAADLGSLGMR